MNEEMLEMVRREYQETAERIETKSYYKWQEENKRALSFWGQVSMEIAYGCLSYECIIAEKPYLERIERERARNAVKEPANVKGEAENNAGGGESGTPSIKDTNITSQDVVFGSNAKSAQKLGNQMTNRGWTEEIVNQTIDAPYTTRASINKATGNSATVFYTQQGSYVIVDDVTKAIVQVSDNINPATWVPDSSIVDPYIP